MSVSASKGETQIFLVEKLKPASKALLAAMQRGTGWINASIICGHNSTGQFWVNPASNAAISIPEAFFIYATQKPIYEANVSFAFDMICNASYSTV